MSRDEPCTLSVEITLKTKLYNHSKERSRAKAMFSEHSVPKPETSSTKLTPSHREQSPESMQIARTRLSPQERQRRLANNYCLYCGSPQHFRVNWPACPNKSPFQCTALIDSGFEQNLIHPEIV